MITTHGSVHDEQLNRALVCFDIDPTTATCSRLPSISNLLFRVDSGQEKYVVRITPLDSWIPLQIEMAVQDQISMTPVSTRQWHRNSQRSRTARLDVGYAMV